MDNVYTSQLQGAGQFRELTGINRAVPVPVIISLEQRLDHLARGVERTISIRQKLENIEMSLANPQEPAGPQGASQPSLGLSGRFGDTIGYLHTNLDEIERIVRRIDSALFDEKAAKAAQCAPARG